MLLNDVAFQLHRLFRAQPILCGSLAAGAFMLLATALFLADLRRETRELSAEAARLTRLAAARVSQAPIDPGQRAVSLQPFNSAQFVQALEAVSMQVEVPLDEVSFALDEVSGQPFRRYRASFSVTARYLAIRRFIDSVHGELRDVSLDSIACTREKMDSPLLKCDLAFSAFYARDERG